MEGEIYIMDFKIAVICIRSIVGIITTGLVIGYLGLTDPVIIGGWFAGITAWVLIEKKQVVSPLENIVKEVRIIKLDSMNEIISTASYLVYPKETFYFEGKSEAGLHTATTDFVIAGIINKKHIKDHSSFNNNYPAPEQKSFWDKHGTLIGNVLKKY